MVPFYQKIKREWVMAGLKYDGISGNEGAIHYKDSPPPSCKFIEPWFLQGHVSVSFY